ncbi:hypothetical protein AXG93_2841s1160 [Marchantia polymorpha subsp. ruderalis]|uniref:Uncharacterized protein n=1 Tax=Marchantia polymorpha subsp. ruderalis TaxID=1480154 RepID=A0A176WTH6_MARPO|nr:hypothetical protein AXG93_2841s1160 [Marchantia polymorpha subsp. ruderalis]
MVGVAEPEENTPGAFAPQRGTCHLISVQHMKVRTHAPSSIRKEGEMQGEQACGRKEGRKGEGKKAGAGAGALAGLVIMGQDRGTSQKSWCCRRINVSSACSLGLHCNRNHCVAASLKEKNA